MEFEGLAANANCTPPLVMTSKRGADTLDDVKNVWREGETNEKMRYGIEKSDKESDPNSCTRERDEVRICENVIIPPSRSIIDEGLYSDWKSAKKPTTGRSLFSKQMGIKYDGSEYRQIDENGPILTNVRERVFASGEPSPTAFAIYGQDSCDGDRGFPKVFHRSKVMNKSEQSDSTESDGEDWDLDSTTTASEDDDRQLWKEISDENDRFLNRISRSEIESMREQLKSELSPEIVGLIKEKRSFDSEIKNGGRILSISRANELLEKLKIQKVQSSIDFVDRFEKQPSNVKNELKSSNVKNNFEKVESSNFKNELKVESSNIKNELKLKSSNIKNEKVESSNFKNELKRSQNVKKSLVEQLEVEKLKWMEPVQKEPPRSKDHMDAANYRFDFDGRLLSYPGELGDMPLEQLENPKDIAMLLHHGDSPSQPGYTVEELCILSRSLQPGQRTIALKTIRHILKRAKNGSYCIPNELHGPDRTNFVNSLIITHLLQSSKLVLLLRHAIDDSHQSVLSEAIQCLAELVYSESDMALDAWSELNPTIDDKIWPLAPFNAFNLSPVGVWDQLDDEEKMEVDLVFSLLDLSILARIRYILEVIQPGGFLSLKCLHVILRIVRHSSRAAEHLIECPRLLMVLGGFAFADEGGFDEFKPRCENTSSNVRIFSLHILRMACQASKKVARRCLRDGIVDRAIHFLIPSSRSESNSPSYDEICAVEALKLVQIQLQFGFFASKCLDLLQMLVEMTVGLGSRISHDISPLLKAHIFDIFNVLVHLAKFTPNGNPVHWSHVSPLFNVAINQLKIFLHETNPLSSYDHVFLASLLNFLTSYFDRALALPSFILDGEKKQLVHVTYSVFAKFMTQSNALIQILSVLTNEETWITTTKKPGISNSKPSITDYSLLGPYTLSLKCHPSPSWKDQSPIEPFKIIINNSIPARIPTLVSTLLCSLRLSEKIGRHETNFAGFLTNSNIFQPLQVLLEYYTEYAHNLSNKTASLLTTRPLHHLAFQIAKIMHHGSTAAHEASLICIGRLIPGDEELLLCLFERVIYHFSRDDADPKWRNTEDISPKLLCFWRTTILNGYGKDDGSNEESHKNTNRSSLYIPVEGSMLPLGKNWPYMLLYKLQMSINDHPNCQGDESQKKLPIEYCIQYTIDSLVLIENLERTASGFVSRMEPSVRLYSIHRCFLLDEEVWSNPRVSQLLLNLLKSILAREWPPLNLSIPIDTNLFDQLIEIWAYENVPNSVLSHFISMWLPAGSNLTPDQICDSGQQAELKHLDTTLWSQMTFLWNKLPDPISTEPFFNTTWITRSTLIDKFIAALHCRFLMSKRNSSSFYYRVLIYQVSNFLLRPNSQLVSEWARKNALIILFDYEESAISSEAFLHMIHDVLLLSPYEQRYEDFKEIHWERINSIPQNEKKFLAREFATSEMFKRKAPDLVLPLLDENLL